MARMTTPEEREFIATTGPQMRDLALLSDRLPVLNAGYVRLLDHMGDDLAPVNDARASFRKELPAMRPADLRLLAFLGEADPIHYEPFAHSKIKFEVCAPIMVANEWYRTAVDSCYLSEGHAWSEASWRYLSQDLAFYIPERWRAAAANRKQGSAGPLSEDYQEDAAADLDRTIRNGVTTYQLWIGLGMAPEQARGFLPYAFLYTTFRWTASLYTVARWLRLREGSGALWEIRQYADAVHELTRVLFPNAIAALVPEVQR